MIAKDFIKNLINEGHNKFYGVPDSLLSDLSKSLELDFTNEIKHIITQNEGSAVGIAIGNFLASGIASVVYLQNSGLGNIINPVTSLATKDVYNIPIIFLIGWRGKPKTHDEPQHKFQGQITIQQLELLNIDYQIVNNENYPNFELMKKSISQNRQFAFVFEKNFFTKDTRSLKKKSDLKNRKNYLEKIYSIYVNDAIFISTTGKTSRELYFINKKSKNNAKIFYTIGGMGHASSIAIGLGMIKKDKKIVILDGDGSLLMHMGILPIIGDQSLGNLYHFVFNNSSHESVGNQPTVANKIDLEKISIGSSYQHYFKFSDLNKLEKFLNSYESYEGPVLIEIEVNQESDPTLGRPEELPIDNKNLLMNLLIDNV